MELVLVGRERGISGFLDFSVGVSAEGFQASCCWDLLLGVLFCLFHETVLCHPVFWGAH